MPEQSDLDAAREIVANRLGSHAEQNLTLGNSIASAIDHHEAGLITYGELFSTIAVAIDTHRTACGKL